MTITPDIPGFVAAQQTLRANFGSLITFHVPQDPAWPTGTRINPDTNEPFDAMAVRTNAEFTDVQVTALVVEKDISPLRPAPDTRTTEIGMLSGSDVVLDIDPNDYDTVKDATEFDHVGKRYRIEEWKAFDLANLLYKYLCYGEEH